MKHVGLIIQRTGNISSSWATCQCSHWCWSHSWCHWSQEGRCRCSCWHSQCNWPRFYTGCSHTHLCLAHIFRHGTQADKYTWTCWCHRDTGRRYCRDLKHREGVLKLPFKCFILSACWGFVHVLIVPYLVCSHQCLSHTSGQCNLAGTCTGSLP